MLMIWVYNFFGALFHNEFFCGDAFGGVDGNYVGAFGEGGEVEE